MPHNTGARRAATKRIVLEAETRFRPKIRHENAAARGTFGRARDADAQFGRSVLLTRQRGERAGWFAVAAALAPCGAHQESAGRSAGVPDARRAQGGRSA